MSDKMHLSSDEGDDSAAIRQVIYISQATRSIPPDELNDLVAIASRNNRRHDVTGALLYIESSFIQVLEGGTKAINRLLETIGLDKRHENMRIVSDQELPFRHFEEWSMAVVKPSTTDSRIVVGELSSSGAVSSEEDSIVVALPQTIAMMERMYKTDQALQRARH